VQAPRKPMALVPLSVRIAQEELDFLDQLASQHEGILSKQGVVRLLLQYAAASQWDPLDKPVILGVQSAAGTPSSSNSSSSLKVSNKEKNRNGVKSRKRAAVTPEFEAFWRAYQSCPRKVPSQSKAKSWDEWQKVIKHETPERLVQAAEAAVRDAINCEWDYKLPDCFRWLRDGRYSVLLETHTPAQKQGDWL
jgi:hypothetical protein